MNPAGENLPLRRYEPDRQRRLGLRAYAEMFRELRGAWELLARLVRRDVLLRTRVSFLGLFWSVAQPALFAAVFVLLRRNGVFRADPESVPYGLYAYAGLLHWQLFANLLTHSASSLVGASNLVAKVAFPREALVLAACARAGFDWLCGLPVLAALCVWTGTAPAWTAVLAPLALAPLVLFGLGLAHLLAVLTLPVRDLVHALPMLLALGLFLTPVLYELPEAGPWPFLRALNPVAVSLDALRGLLFAGTLRDPWALAAWSALGLAAYLGCWRLFRLLTIRVPEFA
ncbi:MAG: ABC transporter permease [Planctomycetota bacterium]|nr:ABC transporter permease [Planctomycetota bacterium]